MYVEGVKMSKKYKYRYACVRISKEVDDKFREFIVKKYGTFKKGMYKKEAEQAILEYIERHEKEQKS